MALVSRVFQVWDQRQENVAYEMEKEWDGEMRWRKKYVKVFHALKKLQLLLLKSL